MTSRAQSTPPPDFTPALCAQSDPELFFPEHEGQSEAKRAMKVCVRCPLITECLEYALTDPAGRYGIWAGTTSSQRDAIRKARGFRFPTEVEVMRDKILARLRFGWDVDNICADLGVHRETVTRYMRATA